MAERKRDKILLVRKLTPALTYKEVARAVGCSAQYVQQVCYEERAGRGRKKRRWKEKYLAIRQQHPTWTTNQIAAEMKAPRSYIYRLATALGHEEGIRQLGLAARRAGLTLNQIEGMAHGR